MKTKVNVMKKVLGFVLTLVMVCSMLPMTSNAAETDTTVYFKADHWLSDEAWLAMYYYGGSDPFAGWAKLTDTDGDGYYEAVVPAGYSTIIFCRMNPANQTLSWDAKWNQTADLSLPTDGNNCCTLSSSDFNGATGTWHAHSYTDGLCANCGEYENGMGKLTGHSLSLEGNIGINFYMNLDPDVKAGGSGAYMQFTYPDSTTKIVNVSDVTPDGDTYKFTCEVAAKEMTDNISAKLIWGTKEYDAGTYSVKTYADEIIEAETYGEKTENLVKAMLNYGGYSQTYFDYKTTSLANADLNIALDSTGIEAYNAVVSTNSAGSFKANLELRSQTTFNVKFAPETVSVVTINGVSENELVKSGSDYVISYANINASQLDDTVTVTVVDSSDGTTTITCSPLSYCASVIEKNTNEKLVNVAKALYAYNQAANTYVQ